MEVSLQVTFDDSTVLSFAFLIALILIFTVLRIMYSGRRGQRLRGLAHQLGLTIEGEAWDRSSRAPQLESPLFTDAKENKFGNIMSVTRDGMTSNFFDFSYGDGGTRISQTVAAFTQDLWMPTFKVGPPGIASRHGSRHSSPGIQFDFNPEFSKRFRLEGPDETRIRNLFTHRVVSFLLEIDSQSKWRFEGSDFTLIIYRYGVTVKPAEYSAFIRETAGLAKGFLGRDY